MLADATFTDMKAAPFVAATATANASGGANFTISAPFVHKLGIALTPISVGGVDDVLNLRIDGTTYTTAANSVSNSANGLTITGADIINISNKSAVVAPAAPATVGTAPTVWLQAVGVDATNAVDINITGEVATGPIVTPAPVLGAKALNLSASVGSKLWIDTVTITNTAGVDLTGMATSNVMDGFQKAVTINGGAGNDKLVGGQYNDNIKSGAGNNEIHGSLGKDAVDLTGGLSDVLIFKSAAQSAFGATADSDTVTGFSSGTDKINLAGAGLMGGKTFGGNVADVAAGNTALGVAANAAFDSFFSAADNTLYIDVNNDNTINAGDMAIKLTGVTTLTATDLLYI